MLTLARLRQVYAASRFYMYINTISTEFLSCTGLTIIDLTYNINMIFLSCTTIGRPVDSVMWWRNGLELSDSSSQFIQSQAITDRVTVAYQHTLSSENAADFVGEFSCLVRDGSGQTHNRTLILNGKILCIYT